MTRTYRLFGLRIASDLDLPDLPLAQGAPDAVIRRARLSFDGEDAVPVRSANAVSFRIDGVAAFRIENGRQILVDAEPGQDERNVRLYLLGTAVGLLLFQRGDVPLHANAIAVEGKAVAVTGPSGAGKSTLAALAVDRGLSLLSDDVAVIRQETSGPTVSAGHPRLRLWKDTLEAKGIDPSGLARAYVSADEWDKFDIPLASVGPAVLPLAAIFHLEVGPSPEVLQVSGAQAARLLIENVYRGDWATTTKEREAIFRWSAWLSHAVPVFRLVRPLNLSLAGAALDSIIDVTGQLARRMNGN